MGQSSSRRHFVKTIGKTGAFFILAPGISWPLRHLQPDPKVAGIVERTIGIDTHNHIDVPLDKSELPGPKLDLSGEIKVSGLSAIVMTFATDYKRNIQPGEAFERFTVGLDSMDKVISDNGMTRAYKLADFQRAHDEHHPIVVQSVEGSHFLEGKSERVEYAYKRGLRQLGLLHDSDASTPLGDVYTNAPKYGGLTEFGKEVIKECNRQGILIDLTHASNETINAALKISSTPVIVSHTGLDTRLGNDEQMANMMRPRLISREEAKIVAGHGGVIGVWTHLSDTPLSFAENIRAMVDVVGIDHVCIGTDTKMTPPYRPPMNPGPGQGNPPAKDSSSKKPDNEKNRGRAGERTNDSWTDQKAGFYYVVVDAMLKTGFTENDIAKIGGGNYARIFNLATAGH